jgi:metal-responsive CopG/Arc/MetJ family transcriptional regulator
MPMISLQIPKTLQEELDAVQAKLELPSRSETLRECINLFIRENSKNTGPTKGHKIANISVVHQTKRAEVLDIFGEICIKHEHLIKSISQYNLKNHLVKSIITAGAGEEIHEFYQTLSKDRHFQCSITYLLIPEKFPEEENEKGKAH